MKQIREGTNHLQYSYDRKKNVYSWAAEGSLESFSIGERERQKEREREDS